MLKNNLKYFIFKFLLIFTLLIIFVCISAYSYADTISSKLSDSVLRLHVIANSDSTEDQSLKYAVRNSLINLMNSLSLDTTSKSDAINIINSHIDDFYNVAINTISSYGYDYPVSITIEKSTFPTKAYGDITFPAGIYDALKVEIGKASGRNWWCVMFPPLCFVDIDSAVISDDSKNLLENELDSEEYTLITDLDNSDTVAFKFKIVEIIENFKISFLQNN